MSRPLLQHGIGQLERLFEEGQSDHDTLRALEQELSFRAKPRAASLLRKVRGALGGATVAPVPEQDALFEIRRKAAKQTQIWEPEATTSNLATSSSPIPPEGMAELPDEIPVLSVDGAYKALGVQSSTSWEAIETARRQIVDRAYPLALATLGEAQRTAITLAAARANAAYRLLAQKQANPSKDVANS